MKKNKEMEENKKSHVILITVLVVLLLIAFTGFGYAIGTLRTAESLKETLEEKEEVKEKQPEELALDDERFVNIYNRLQNYMSLKDRENGVNSFTNKEIATIGISSLTEDDFTETGEKDEWGRTYFTFSADKVLENAKMYLGNEVSIDFNKVVEEGVTVAINSSKFKDGSGMSIKSYDENSRTFKCRFAGIGGTTGPAPKITSRKIVKATLLDDTITVTEKIFFIQGEGNGNQGPQTYHIYSDREKTNLIDTKVFELENIMEQTISIDDYLETAGTITQIYKYDQENNRYYFASSKLS